MEDLITLEQESRVEPRAQVRHLFLRYGIAVVSFAATIGLSMALTYVGLSINYTIPIVVSLVATAWYGGRGPGLLISVLFLATTLTYATPPPGDGLLKTISLHFSVFCLYLFLVFLMSGLRRLLERLQQHRDLLQVTLASIGDAVIATDPTGRITFMNPAAAKLTGASPFDAKGAPVGSIFRVVDEITGELAPNAVERVLSTGVAVDPSDRSILIARDGREIPIADSAAPIIDGGQVKGVVLVFSDMTERKLMERSRRDSEMMGRLVEAQEAERRRIARDLHDHLGQKMTALRLRVESLTDDCIDNPALFDAIGEVQRSASHIDRDIGFLSWELRPTELEDLGLANALGSFVREWSQQHGISAEFQMSRLATQNAGGRLPLPIETNLYRISQEALNNVLKHARATNVSVMLHQGDAQVSLIVEDDGIGFDEAPEAPDTPSRRGLGLISMQERSELMKGNIEIDSQPGSGTTIHVNIPLQPPPADPARNPTIA